jgi:hypothetical protein
VLGLERILGSQEWVSNLRWVLLVLLLVGSVAFGWYVLYKQKDDV